MSEPNTHPSTNTTPDETPGLTRRIFLSASLNLGVTLATTVAADGAVRRSWNEVIGQEPQIETVYGTSRGSTSQRHLVHVDGTGTTHSWSSHTLIPSAGQFAHIHAVKHGTHGVDPQGIARLVHERIHALDNTPSSQNLYSPLPHEVVLVGTSQGANLVVAMAAELLTNPLYRNTRLGALVLRDPTFGEDSILGVQQLAARGMNAGRAVVSQAGPLEYYLGELAHVSFDSIPWWEKPAEAWRRTMHPIGVKTLSDQLDMIRSFPEQWPGFAKALAGVPIHLIQSGNDELVDSIYSHARLAAQRPDIITHDLPGATHATFYFDDDPMHRAQYYNQSAVIQQILLSLGWKAEWDVARQQPYESPKKTTRRTVDATN
ncbi:alpha/beta hydrolase [Candidatus Saccharibacteria bacterium]|nr:MAG: alpha/beta hydrolase [Candidatus Saccharibacteria bacterium]